MAVTIEIQARDKKTKPGALRRSGTIPATIYGPDFESRNIQLNARDFRRVSFKDYTHLIRLEEKGSEGMDALIKNVQKNYLDGSIQNIEFYRVKKGHKLTTRVILEFVGVSDAVRNGADLFIVHKEAHIRCEASQIPDAIQVDISALATENDHITFADLKLADGIEILDPAAEIICKAETLKIDHELVLAADVAKANEAAEAAKAADAAKLAADAAKAATPKK